MSIAPDVFKRSMGKKKKPKKKKPKTLKRRSSYKS